MKLISKVKSSQEQLLGKNHYLYANTLIFFGMIKSLNNNQKNEDFNEAMNSFETALKILESNFGKTNPFYRMALFEFSASLVDMNEVTKSKKLIENFLSFLMEIECGKQTKEYAWTLNRLGTIYQFQNSYEKAKLFLEQCIEIEEKTIGTECLEFALSLDDLASLYREWEKVEMGMKICERIISLKKKLEETNSNTYANTLWNFGLLCQEKNQFSKALSAFQECLKIQQTTTGDSQQWYFSTLINIGFSQRKLNQHQRAIETYTELAKILEPRVKRSSDDFIKVVADVRYTTDSMLSKKF